MKITQRPLVLLLVIGMAATACGGSSPNEGGGPTSAPTAAPASVSADATPGTDLTACELIIPSDIEVALGLAPGAVDDGKSFPLAESSGFDPAQSACRWDIDQGDLELKVTPTYGAAQFADMVSSREQLGDKARGVGEALDVADGGYWIDDGPLAYSGEFLKGSVEVSLDFLFFGRSGHPDAAEMRAILIELGQAALDRV